MRISTQEAYNQLNKLIPNYENISKNQLSLLGDSSNMIVRYNVAACPSTQPRVLLRMLKKDPYIFPIIINNPSLSEDDIYNAVSSVCCTPNIFIGYALANPRCGAHTLKLIMKLDPLLIRSIEKHPNFIDILLI
jgi:hypothetical protein